MKLENEDKQSIFEIVAARYFTTQNWKWVNLKKDSNKITKAFDELNEQYASYSYVSRDWYVENMGPGISICAIAGKSLRIWLLSSIPMGRFLISL
ncbi:hypothetical protein [Methanosarcina horonobensis]|uniref:hypothetical protein n=1 Tax=Methanosarcina horonobensis TaxID=418008 RepID=UPI000B097096|nr:hypothetical protein [Methanosarcina horonobensis]